VFSWKAVEVVLASSFMVVFFSFPVLFAYSFYFAPRLIDMAAILAIFLFYIICGVFTGILIGLSVPAFFSVRRLYPVLSVVSIIFISGIVILLRALRPEQFGNPDVINNILQYMGGLDIKGLAWLPFYWIARALHLLAKGDYTGYLKMLGLFSGLVLLLTVILGFIQSRFYLVLYDKLNKGSGAAFRSNWKNPRLLRGFLSDYSPLWKKEIKTFFRSSDQWTQLLVVGAIVVVYVLNIRGIALPHPSVKNLIAYLNLGMAAFISAGLNSRFTFTSLPMENPGISMVLASPFEKEKVYRFKLFFYFVPQFFIGILLFLAGDAALKLDSFSRVTGFVFLVPMLPCLTLMALFFSMKVESTVPLSPQHLVISRSGISYMLWSLVYIAAGMVYFVRPMFLFYYSQWVKRPVPFFEITVWYVGFVVLNILFMVILYRRSLSTWKRKEF